MSTMISEIKRAQEKVGEHVLELVRSPDKCSIGETHILQLIGRNNSDQASDRNPTTSQQQVDLGTEPPSGQQGAGTAEEPYDAGNQQEQKPTMSIVDQLSRTKTKEEIAERKRARTLSKVADNTSTDVAKAQSNASTNGATPQSDADRGRDPAPATTASSGPKGEENRPSMKDAPKSKRVIERSVSPGQLPDGSHVKCSGERGEGYTPPSGLGRMKSKLTGGH